MLSSDELGVLLNRLQQHEDEAVSEFAHLYDSIIRHALQRRLRRRAKLRRLIDSTDLVQETWLEFFQGVAEGRFAIPTEEDLVRLLSCIAQRRASHQARWQCQARRDVRRTVDLPPTWDLPVDSSAGQAATEIDALLSRLSAHDAALIRGRLSGRTWCELAAEERMTEDALRIRLKRALRHAAAENNG